MNGCNKQELLFIELPMDSNTYHRFQGGKKTKNVTHTGNKHIIAPKYAKIMAFNMFYMNMMGII